LKIKILFILIVFCSCTVKPRYNTSVKHKINYNYNISSKKKKINYKNTYLGVSSWYGPNFHGKLTANGEVFDMYGVTAAHKDLPLNTVARITNVDNGKNVILRITDRGPFVKGRILDCSLGAAKKLGFYDQGTANVKIDIIELGDNKYMKHIEGY
jgi:rare lipoprotein A